MKTVSPLLALGPPAMPCLARAYHCQASLMALSSFAPWSGKWWLEYGF